MAERRTVRPLLWALGAIVAALLLAFALVVGPWLLTRYPQNGLTAEQALKAKNDVRATLVQALAGLAVAGGLAVTYSTYRQNQRDQAERREEQDRLYQLSRDELVVRRTEQDRTYQLNLAAHVNELYTKAVAFLGHAGHDQAPVRLGALYSLAHLAQANPAQRQTVVDVLCAYLRMPYTEPPKDEETEAVWAPVRQEREVRLTAQRLLRDHVRAPEDVTGEEAQHRPASPNEPFWPGISLDLTGATLVDVNFGKASLVDASFVGTTFTGTAWFSKATFTGTANFDEATFDMAWFAGATFSGAASFDSAAFSGKTAWFGGAIFSESVSFGRAIFSTTAWFRDTTFTVGAHFDAATFFGPASYRPTFGGLVCFHEAEVFHLDVAAAGSRFEWPEGWTVRPDAEDSTRGTLVREERPAD
ncbi:pentapeptide repeat-containing protein [Micromonospora trifolii]|uniref:pentapeptide repeat-containing protein n=1 Tax=Micromonospora trifolii TaxID=2911208 RepID=UPI003CF6CBCF